MDGNPGRKWGGASAWGGRAFGHGLLALALNAAVAGAALAQSADILVNHADSPDPGPAGGLFTYIMRVTNNGPDPAADVMFTNTIPPGSTFISFSKTQGADISCDPAPVGGVIGCNIGTLPVGDPSAVIYSLQVRLPTAGVYTNRVDVTSSTDDPNPSNNRNNDNTKQDTTANAAADLVMNASASKTAVVAGEHFNYLLDVTNQGPNAVETNGRIKVVFTVPAGAAVHAAPSGSGWSCTSAPAGLPALPGATFTCERTGAAAALAVGATTPTITVPAVANIVAGAGSEIAVSYDVEAFQANGLQMPDGELSNNNDVVQITSTPGSDLSITKTGTPATVAVGSNVTFTLTPRLNGGMKPTGTITVTDTLNAALTPVSASGTGWSCTLAQTVQCTRSDGASFNNFSNLPAITVVATANSSASIGNVGSVADVGGLDDPMPGNNTSSTVNVTATNEADLRLTKRASLNPVLVGQDFNYVINVRNYGPLAVPGGQTITVEDAIPAGVMVTAAPTGTNWSCTGPFPMVGPATLTCTRSTGLTTATAGTDLSVPARLTTVGAATNNACVRPLGAGVAVNPIDAADCDGVEVRASGLTGTGADLEVVSKTAAPNPVATGENLTYVISVRNNGPDTATNVRVTDVLNNLMATGSLQSVSASQGSCTPGTLPANGATQTVACELGSLANGAGATVTIVARPRVATTGNRTNTATVWSADVGDPVTTNNSGSVTSQVLAVADLGITKSNTPNPVRAGAPLTYVVTVDNPAGLSTASDVVMTDTLPSNAAFVEFVSAPSATCTTIPSVGQVGGQLICEWPSIATGVQRTVTYRVRPLAAADYTGYEMVNTAVATTTTRNSAGVENPSVSATTTTPVIEPELDVLINKQDNVDPVPLGATVRYTVTVTNNGPSYGTNTVMTDIFPTPGETPTALFSYQGNLAVSGGGVCTEPATGVTSGTLRCTWPGLASGQTETVAYDMIAETITTPGGVTGTGYNQATVEVDEEETTLANNIRRETTDTSRAPIATDLQLTKTASPSGYVARGANITYTLTVRNNGPLASNGAQVIDTMPAGLVVVSAPGCVAAGSTLNCSVGALAVGAEKVFTIVAQVPMAYSGPSPAVNRAVVDAPGDTDPGNNEDEASTNVPPPGNATGIPALGPAGLLMLLFGVGMAARLQRRVGRR